MSRNTVRASVALITCWLLVWFGLSLLDYDPGAALSDFYDTVGKWVLLFGVVAIGTFTGLQLDRAVNRRRSELSDSVNGDRS